jgi:hypothetical protein
MEDSSFVHGFGVTDPMEGRIVWVQRKQKDCGFDDTGSLAAALDCIGWFDWRVLAEFDGSRGPRSGSTAISSCQFSVF